MLTLGSDME